jgi:hypothetical protein
MSIRRGRKVESKKMAQSNRLATYAIPENFECDEKENKDIV